ncbi:MAG: CPBP family intramembrane metalloprotease, partial [Sedimentitalea sp.]|nr:CPBP family intramembrane metalloprotease [Sedimentitalea sp.]
RPPLGLIGPLPLAVVQFWRVLRMLLILGAVLLVLPPYDMGAALSPNLPPATWALLLPLSLGAVLIQAGTEELLFRGYIQQALAARFSSPLVWMVLPSALFALGHYLPAEAGQNALPIALWSGIFGVLMADLTARAGTLGPAIAVHLVNNVSALLIVSLPDTLSGLSLFTVPYSMSDAEALRGWLAIDFATMFVCWLAARLALRR